MTKKHKSRKDDVIMNSNNINTFASDANEEQNRIINFNPVFVNDDSLNNYNKIKIIEFPMYILVLVELLIIAFIFYYFFSDEMIFTYNTFQKKNTSVNDDFIAKINDMYLYTPSCDTEGHIILTDSHGYTINAKYFDGNIIKFNNQIDCNTFLTTNFN